MVKTEINLIDLGAVQGLAEAHFLIYLAVSWRHGHLAACTLACSPALLTDYHEVSTCALPSHSLILFPSLKSAKHGLSSLKPQVKLTLSFKLQVLGIVT